MSVERAEALEATFLQRVAAGDLPHAQHVQIEDALLLQLFESQVLSRQLDYTSRRLQARGESFYTIGSAGHEGNAAIAAALRTDDMAFLHYRDAAFFIQRARQAGQDPTRDLLLSFAASSADPIAAGRHKVLGSYSLAIPPQTSTIASHLPKAVGAAVSIGLNKRSNRTGVLAEDGLVVCSFGDASLNHSTAQGAINTVSWMAHQKMHVPLLLVCEDNGIGISTKTPESWVEQSMCAKPGIHYIACDGLDLADTYRAAREAEELIRTKRCPVFLHMRCVRLLGHAGSDVESTYRSAEEIAAGEAKDPLLMSAAQLMAAGLLDANGIAETYQRIGAQVASAAEEVITQPKLASAQAVMKSIVPPGRKVSSAKPTKAAREACFGTDLSAMAKPAHMSRLLSWALADLMLEQENILLAGEDIAQKGGVYGVTSKLHKRFGSARVINTLLDEQTILGMAIGMAHNGILPIAEIQFLAYLHNAEDQLRGEAATLSFFSNGQFTNPMVVRVAGLAYQRGFGGHFHNDNSIAVLRDLPGVIVACPSNGRDAVQMLRESVRLAQEEQRVVVFIEPIALYSTKDLYEVGDGGWSVAYEEVRASAPVRLGDVATQGTGKDICILTYGNGFYLSSKAQKCLKEEHKIDSTLIDIRWLSPLPEKALLEAVKDFKKILIVDECRRSGSVSEALMALLTEQLPRETQLSRLCAEDSFIPIGTASTLTLPSEASIIDTVLGMCG